MGDRRRPSDAEAPPPSLRRSSSQPRMAVPPLAFGPPPPRGAHAPPPRSAAAPLSRGASLASIASAGPGTARGGATPRAVQPSTRPVLDAPALDTAGLLRRAADPRRAASRGGAALLRTSAPFVPARERGLSAASEAGAAPDLGAWHLVAPDGGVAAVEVDRAALTEALGMAHRDLRVVDPQLADSYPSALLARGGAILVRLDAIKAIVSADWALVADGGRPPASDFVAALAAALGGEPVRAGGDAAPAGRRRRSGVARLLARVARGPAPAGGDRLAPTPEATPTPRVGDGAPFELRVLEAALDFTTASYHTAITAIERAAGPCLRTPTATKLTTDFLKRLRALKQRVAVARVKLETVKEVLERLLDDEGDMAALLVSVAGDAGDRGGGGRERERGAREGTPHHAHHRATRALFRRLSATGPRRPSFAGGRPSPAAALAAALERTSSTGGGADPDAATAAAAAALAVHLERRSSGSLHGRRVSALAAALAGAPRAPRAPPAPPGAVEQLLETVSARLEADFDRLQATAEMVDSVEVLLDLELDVFRNANLKLRILFSSAGLGALAVFAVTGYLAMNLAQPMRGIEPEGGGSRLWPPASAAAFVAASTTAAVLAVGIVLVLLAWMAHRGMAPLTMNAVTVAKKSKKGGGEGGGAAARARW